MTSKMEYYDILNFKKEPFSNSPEPEFFFEAPKHIGCLQKLELSVRLRRGLNVVIGDIGTGKTTLCRKLIQQFSFSPKDSQEIETHLLLDPSFNSSIEFLQTVSMLLGIKEIEGQESEWQLKEKIKNYLFNKGVSENKIVVLIIDEGQKIPENCIEILREFLNYETNNYKLLQIIIFAQLEFKKILKKYANLSDRINVLYYLKSLKFKHMREMIKYRISVARNFENYSAIFTYWGLLAIYLATGGYPRKVVSLCHQVLLMLIIRGKNKADFFLVRSCLIDMHYSLFRGLKWAALSSIFIAAGISAGALFWQNQSINLSEYFSVPKIIAEAQQMLSDHINPPTANIPEVKPMPQAPISPASSINTSSVSAPSVTAEAQKIPTTPITSVPANIPEVKPMPQAPIAPSPSVNTTSLPAPAIKSETKQIPQASITPTPSTKTTSSPEPSIIPENKIQEIKMPASLGILTLKKGRTLWRAINNIYGEVTSEIMEKIFQANPHINSKKLITAGQKITLPSIPANIKPIQEGNLIVVLAKGKDIKKMYDFFHENNYKQNMPSIAFFPFWNSKDGMTFAVVLDKIFNNAETAKEAINKLPGPMAKKAQIISQWDENTVFFNRQALKH
jgi:general secretion pathway protein A